MTRENILWKSFAGRCNIGRMSVPRRGINAIGHEQCARSAESS